MEQNMELNMMENDYISVTIADEEEEIERDDDYYTSNSMRKRVYLEQKETKVEPEQPAKEKRTLIGALSNFYYYNKGLFIAAGAAVVIALAYVLTRLG